MTTSHQLEAGILIKLIRGNFNYSFFYMEPVAFTTKSGNHYLYSFSKGQFFPIDNDTFNYIIGLSKTKTWLYNFLDRGGYLCDFSNSFNAQISAKDIKISIANLSQIVFETTTLCNLKCKYCCYGDGYTTFKYRKQGNSSFSKAKVILDYLVELFQTSENNSTDTKFAISFYGGEPLMNFPFIARVVNYSRNLHFQGRRVHYTMTTNATLLSKYCDFLYENQFRLLISLDGERKHNGYRTLKNGNPSFDTVINNLKRVRDRYPDWFKTFRFNSVVTDISDITEIISFFKTEFDSIPTFSPLHTSTDMNGRESSFINEIGKKITFPKEFYQNEEYIPYIPEIKKILNLIVRLSFNYVIDELELFNKQNNLRNFNSASCVPFSKRMFVDCFGGLHPCEKVCRDEPLGLIEERVKLDHNTVAHRYNTMIASIKTQCKECYSQLCCNRCLFEEQGSDCRHYTNKSQFAKILANAFSILEKYPDILEQLNHNVIIR